ncbi:MAG: hypothetical protein HLUCCO02_09005 [Idiomarinaceae bacterium HL-53]|nr:MAG: hypothetical protein HLUCCO02_09005 [Idiomarinaceae bacterium HL-53]CUS47670.1 hypothetical protein Ga0003345_0603 [Idiomarinaceae bacterium HL-53]
MLPYLISKATPLKQVAKFPTSARYDSQKQLWIDLKSGRALVDVVLENRTKQISASDFGETVCTKSGEGTDQSEVIQASDFGETLITETGEGTDQSEILCSSDFGETIQTNTGEGSDVLS